MERAPLTRGNVYFVIRQLLSICVLATSMAVLSGCTPTVDAYAGTWINPGDNMTLRLDTDGTAELDAMPIPILNLSGAPETVLDDVVGTWEVDGDHIIAAFETANGHRELSLQLTGSGDSEALEMTFPDRLMQHLWLDRADPQT